jgi:hypothetical protein
MPLERMEAAPAATRDGLRGGMSEECKRTAIIGAATACPVPIPPAFEALVEAFCQGQAELRARLAMAGADRPLAERAETGGQGDGQE